MMNTQAWFPCPVYVTQAQDEIYEEVQSDLFKKYSELSFKQNEGWSPDTHELSIRDDEELFQNNHLEGCSKFLDFLHINLMTYLDELRCVQPRQYDITQGWFTRTKKGKYAHLHDHGASDISGVYYLKSNGNDGNLYFIHPLKQLSSNYIFNTITSVDQEMPLNQGQLALWPSTLWHGTATNTTDNERISVSFNIHFRR